MADEAPNPLPNLITEASWRFMLALLALEPNTVNAGIFANKSGYHNTRRNNLRSWPGSYSIQHPLDLQGPDDKAAGYDWTHNTAHGGDYRSMRKYGDRIKAAWQAHDPRLYGWREVQGMVSGSSVPVDLNFAADGWRQGGTPADSHKWHKHLSEHRAFVESWHNKECMLSILRGETLADYLARGGKLMMGDDDEMSAQAEQHIEHMAWRVEGLFHMRDTVVGGPDKGTPIPLTAAVKAVEASVKAVEAKVAQLSQPVPSPVDPAALKAVLLDREVLAAIAKAVTDEIGS